MHVFEIFGFIPGLSVVLPGVLPGPTSSYYRPALREAGAADWETHCIDYDAANIINHPDRGKDAIGKHALREAKGFDDSDALSIVLASPPVKAQPAPATPGEKPDRDCHQDRARQDAAVGQVPVRIVARRHVDRGGHEGRIRQDDRELGLGFLWLDHRVPLLHRRLLHRHPGAWDRLLFGFGLRARGDSVRHRGPRRGLCGRSRRLCRGSGRRRCWRDDWSRSRRRAGSGWSTPTRRGGCRRRPLVPDRGRRGVWLRRRARGRCVRAGLRRRLGDRASDEQGEDCEKDSGRYEALEQPTTSLSLALRGLGAPIPRAGEQPPLLGLGPRSPPRPRDAPRLRCDMGT